jgi:hypothetical protein
MTYNKKVKDMQIVPIFTDFMAITNLGVPPKDIEEMEDL